MKSEPGAYSIDDLERDGSTCWDGVRNYQARNFMRDAMSVGDPVLFYHSNANPPGVAGVARVCSEAHPDHTAWDRESRYFDARSRREDPVWMMVDVEFVEKFKEPVTLPQLKANRVLDGLLVVKRGQRLSIQPVEARHFRQILKMATFEVD